MTLNTNRIFFKISNFTKTLIIIQISVFTIITTNAISSKIITS